MEKYTKVAIKVFGEPVKKFLPYFPNLTEHYGIETDEDWKVYLAQVGHESMNFRRTRENLNYSVKNLLDTWPIRFGPGKLNPVNYAHKPQHLANTVYANRLGNGSYETNDGWFYRGAGLKMTTGEYNFSMVNKDLGPRFGINLLKNPELLETPKLAVWSSGYYWKEKNLGYYARKRQFKEVTLRLNGGLIGYEDRLKLYEQIHNAWTVIQ